MDPATALSAPPGPRYRWWGSGDVNAFFGLMLDNVVNLALLAGILVFGFGFPANLVYGRMFPGTALGVLIGDAIYTWLAFRLARRTGRDDVTAMPLGLDSPSTIGIAVAVLGPAFIAAKSSMPDADAAVLAWQVGMATVVLIGAFKIAMSFFGEQVRRLLPVAGLLGSIGGVALALLGAYQLGEIFAEPVVGLVSLGIIIYALVARLRLPFGAPAVLVSVAVGTILYYLLGSLGLSLHPIAPLPDAPPPAIPMPTLGFVEGLPIALRDYLPLALPFALLTILGGINVTESARLAGDDYRMRDILLTEGVATLVAGLFGGVAQTTPYIGHPAYKAMGGRAAYTLATGIFIGLGGMLGYIAVLSGALPRPALAPILVFIALEIMGQAVIATPARHVAAVLVATLPSLAQLAVIFLAQVHNGALLRAPLDPAGVLAATGITNPAFITFVATTVLVGNGWFITAMLWGSLVAFLIDRRTRAASLTLAVAAALALFGFIHSVLPTGGLYLPWESGSAIPYHWAAGYLILAGLIAILPRARPVALLRAP